MKEKSRRRPSYGIQAPKDLLVFVPVAIATLVLFLVFQSWWRFFFLAGFAYFLYTSISILVGSTTWYREKLSKFIVSQCGAKRGSRVLDVGCGSGSLAIAFAKHIQEGEVWGIDIWKKGDLLGNVPEKVMENAKIEGVQDIVKVKYADARDIPFPRDYFDAIGSVFVIHNIRPNREKAIFEMIRVLKAGGILTVAEAGGIVWWLKYDVLPKLLKEERLKDIKIKRCLFNQVMVVKKGRSARC